MTTDKKLSLFTESQLPDYVQNFYPLFLIFATKYFEWLDNSSTGVQHSLQNIELNRDIDTTANNLVLQFLNTYMPSVPDTTVADQQLVLKHFREFYERKGSEQSFKFFFRAFYDDDIEVKYPRDTLFMPSANTWYIERNIRATRLLGNPTDLKHTWVTGNTSGASAAIDNVVRLSGSGASETYNIIFQNNTVSTTSFSTGETIAGIYYDHASGLTSLVTLTALTAQNTLPGRYLNDRSKLSSKEVLQDSLYYQQFSYVVKSSVERERWIDAILKTLHPSGTKLFNEYYVATEQTDSSFGKTLNIETTVGIPTRQIALTAPTFTFDRTGDLQTGTSRTLTATSTGFAVVTYANPVGDISFDAAYDYPGEHITFALQKISDVFTPTEIVRPDGAMWDKYSRTVALDPQIIQWNYDTNSSLVATRFTTYGVSDYLGVGATFLLSEGDVRIDDNTILNSNVDGSFITDFNIGDYLFLDYDNPIDSQTYRIYNIADDGNSMTVIPAPDFSRNFSEIYRVDFGSTSTTLTYPASSQMFNGTSGVLTYKIPLADVTSNSSYVGSMLLMLTAQKNSRGNDSDEIDNTLHIRVTSNVTFVPYFGAVEQEVYKDIALNRSITERNLIYYHSSNSVQNFVQIAGTSNTVAGSSLVIGTSTEFLQFSIGDTFFIDQVDTTAYTITSIANDTSMTVSPAPVDTLTGSLVYRCWLSGLPVSSYTNVVNTQSAIARFQFEPYNMERGVTYDRFAMRIELDQPIQLNTSLTETFDSVNITSTGLIADYSSLTTSVSATSFNGSTSSLYTFTSPSFMFNNDAGVERYITTTSFPNSYRVDVKLDYIVGDSYNGGNQPEAAEDLELQYSTDATVTSGSTWFHGATIWEGGSSNVWTYGNTSVRGRVVAAVGDTNLFGINTNFNTDIVAGDVVLIGSSVATTAYTVTNIVNNTQIAITPAIVDDLGTQENKPGVIYGLNSGIFDNPSSNISRIKGYGTGFTTSVGRDIVINIAGSTTSYGVLNVVDDETLLVTPKIIGTSGYGTVIQRAGEIKTVSGSASILGIGTSFASDSSFTLGRVLYFNQSSHSIIATSTSIATTGGGTIVFTSGSTTVNGTNINFIANFSTGDSIIIGSSWNSSNQIYVVQSFVNEGEMIVDVVGTALISGVTVLSKLTDYANTAYTITATGDDTNITVSPAPIDSFGRYVATSITGTFRAFLNNSSNLSGVNTTFNLALSSGDTIKLNTSSEAAQSYLITATPTTSGIRIYPPIDADYNATSSATGTILGRSGNTFVSGLNTLFRSQLTTGSVVQFDTTSWTTSYHTITSIPSDNTFIFTPALNANLFTTSSGTGTGTSASIISTTRLTATIGSPTTYFGVAGSGTYNVGEKVYVDSTTGNGLTSQTIHTITGFVITGGYIRSIDISPAYTFTATGFYKVNKVSSNSTLYVQRPYTLFNTTTTGYTSVYAVTSNAQISIKTGGSDFFKIVPASAQFQTTSLTLIEFGENTSITVRIKQTGETTTPLNEDVYAIDNLVVDSYRNQYNTGVVNIVVATSSGSAYYVRDADFLDITTIGTI